MHKLGSLKSWNRKAALLCCVVGGCLELFALVAEFRIYRARAARRSLQFDRLRFPPRFRGIRRCQAYQQVKESAREGHLLPSEQVLRSILKKIFNLIIIVVLLDLFFGEFKLLVANCLDDSERVEAIVNVFFTLSL